MRAGQVWLVRQEPRIIGQAVFGHVAHIGHSTCSPTFSYVPFTRTARCAWVCMSVFVRVRLCVIMPGCCGLLQRMTCEA